MDEIQAELSAELTAEDYQARFETAREQQNYRDMNELFAEMKAHDFDDLVLEFKKELNDTELASLATSAHIMATWKGMEMINKAMGL